MQIQTPMKRKRYEDDDDSVYSYISPKVWYTPDKDLIEMEFHEDKKMKLEYFKNEVKAEETNFHMTMQQIARLEVNNNELGREIEKTSSMLDDMKAGLPCNLDIDQDEEDIKEMKWKLNIFRFMNLKYVEHMIQLHDSNMKLSNELYGIQCEMEEIKKDKF